MTDAKKQLILGTALWGWGINKDDAFSILDNFVKLGGFCVDCATNYPINKNINDLGLALKWLEEWNNINKANLFIIVKIGSKDNLGSPSYDLSKKYILTSYKKLLERFDDALGCISVHWDDRIEKNDLADVQETLAALKTIKDKGVYIGLSGVKNPALYYNAMSELYDDWIIQCKENFLTNQSILTYKKYFPLSKYYAYGINMGGLKISKDEQSISANIRKINHSEKLKFLILECLNNKFIKSINLKSANDLNMAFIFINQMYNGVIVGPRTNIQLASTFNTWNNLINLDLESLKVLNLTIQKLQKRIRKLD